MRTLPLVLAFALAAALRAGESRDAAAKTVERVFASPEEAAAWSLGSVGFAEWIETVSLPGWTEMLRSETPEFYFAIFRKENRLMFCATPRSEGADTTATSLRSADPAFAERVWEEPTQWAALTCRIRFPEGGLTSEVIFPVWMIRSGFSGNLLIEHKVKPGGAPVEVAFRDVFRETVRWDQPSPEDAGSDSAQLKPE